MNLALICDGPVPHTRMNYRGEVFLRLLPGSGHTVYLIATGVLGAGELRPDIRLVPYTCGQYRPIAGIRSIPGRLWQIVRMFIAAKRILRQDVDLIRTVAFIPTIVAVLARGRGGVPILANMSDFYSDLYLGGKLPFSRPALWLIRRLERLCARADILIVDTPAQRVRWMARGVQPARCVVIPHGLPRSWAGVSPAVSLKPAGAANDPSSPILFYVGDISEMDGLDVLMRATHRLRASGLAARLLIIGKGTDAYWRELRHLMRSLAIDDCVDVIASVRNDDLPAIIERVNICVAPFRLRETSSTSIPNKVLEYLTSQRPIVVPAGSALQQIFGSAFTYFTANDPGSLAGAIEIALATQQQVAARRAAVQLALQWPALMRQEWALIDAILMHEVGDARRFDYELIESLPNEVPAL